MELTLMSLIAVIIFPGATPFRSQYSAYLLSKAAILTPFLALYLFKSCGFAFLISPTRGKVMVWFLNKVTGIVFNVPFLAMVSSTTSFGRLVLICPVKSRILRF